MTTTDTPTRRARQARPPAGQLGPPLLVPALAYGVLMIASVVLAAGGSRSTSPVESLDYIHAHPTALRVAGFLQLASAIPLAIFAGTGYRRLRQLGVTAPGTAIGFAGGILASAALTIEGLCTWTMGTVAGSADVATASALAGLAFGAGSAAFVPTFALLVAGIAVPSLILRLLPRPLAWGCLAVAAIGLLGTFTALTDELDFTLPIGRFGGLICIVAAAVLLPTTRPRRTTPQPTTALAKTTPSKTAPTKSSTNKLSD
ncbi:MAG: DUF4386 domain-containing protein [Sciscionella sp.]|nr:DUF4386 domain-containing protein [Sciscionella sp.]